MFYGTPPPRVEPDTPFLKPGFCKSKRTNKMDPKAREYFYLSSATNYPRESKRVLVWTGNVFITGEVTWVHVPLLCPPTAESAPSMKGEGYDRKRDRETNKLGQQWH